MTFYDWLTAQSGRRDAVGAFAESAIVHPDFPRKAQRLCILLRAFPRPGHVRETAKTAHREWRNAERGIR